LGLFDHDHRAHLRSLAFPGTSRRIVLASPCSLRLADP
jgi:hypothetical protein